VSHRRPEEIRELLSEVLVSRDEAEAAVRPLVRDCLPDENGDVRQFMVSVGGIHAKRVVEAIWAVAESELEKRFLFSLLLSVLSRGDPLGLIVTAPMANAVENMRDLRHSIREFHGAMPDPGRVHWLELIEATNDQERLGGLSPGQASLQRHILFYYMMLGATDEIHLTPQATFPRLLDGRDCRVDCLFWIPDRPGFGVVVECDSYQYHDNREAFDRDRRRSRALQALGFKVLRYSGGEIYNQPCATSVEVLKFLLEERERVPPLKPTT